MRICVLGATGTIGRATVAALVRRGHDVVYLVRSRTGKEREFRRDGARGGCHRSSLAGARRVCGRPVQCIGVLPRLAHLNALGVAQAVGIGHFVLLSTICLQKPLLGLQHAKLAFEAALIACGMRYSIVRPTAFFKSLSGQIERVRKGQPFLVFGDGALTACKPISDGDLANYLADCLEDERMWNRILPIGGPGAAITPRQQGEALFAMLGRPPKFRSAPVRLLDVIAGVLGALGRVVPALAAKAELARIGRYYATESMLVRNPATGRYDAAATPSTGTETLFDYYRAVLAGEAAPERGDHAVF